MDIPKGPNKEVLYFYGYTKEGLKLLLGVPVIDGLEYEDILKELEKNLCVKGLDENGRDYNLSRGGWTITTFISR